MSSLGPSLFFLSDNLGKVIKRMQLKKPPCKLLGTIPINKGRDIRYV